jgi:hypothetical protein
MNPKHLKAVEVPRVTIKRLQGEIQSTEDTPVSKGDLTANTRSWLERVAASGERSLRYGVAGFADGSEPSPFIVKASPNGSVDLAPVLLAVLGVDGLMAGLSRLINAQPEGVSEAHRAQRLAELRASLLKAEHDEQDVIDAAMAEGVYIPYRADARPEIVLRVRP